MGSQLQFQLIAGHRDNGSHADQLGLAFFQVSYHLFMEMCHVLISD